MHDIIKDKVQVAPNAPALHGWDGHLSYRQLDRLSSRLAQHLLNTFHVESGEVVLLAFERSIWTSVAVFAAMKTGATFVLLDTHLPAKRLRQMTGQVGARVILTSRDSYSTVCQLAAEPILVEANAPYMQTSDYSLLPNQALFQGSMTPSSILYIVFTSGSSGTPKAVAISHANFATSVRHHADAYGLTSRSRYLDFASYSFDAALHHILAALMVGACLCVPSEHERTEDLEGAMERMGVTFANMTPTASQLLNPTNVPSLKTLIVAGEPCSQALAQRWLPHVNLINAYGPAECSINSLTHICEPQEKQHIPVGRGLGCVTWIVDPGDFNRLVPIGEVGELLLEGPIVGQGYLDQPGKTRAAFISDPTWLELGAHGYCGRRGLLYKTGDLASYRNDGSIMFAGRKDNQVKLRGQRVELEEVEANVQQIFPKGKNIVDVVQRAAGDNEAVQLVAFLEMKVDGDCQTDSPRTGLEIFLPIDDNFRTAESYLQRQLAERLPGYMVPSLALPIRCIPLTESGKKDRNCLRHAAQQLLDSQTSKSTTVPATPEEFLLQDLWATNLSLERWKIGPDQHYFRLGGDSVSAMRLVGAARARGMSLNMTDILSHPTLSGMASRLDKEAKEAEDTLAPFALLGKINISQTIDRAAFACGVTAKDVQDIYPCTPLQEGLLALTTRKAGAFTIREVLRVREKIDMVRLRQAWAEVFRANSIMRTRFVQLDDIGLKQVVLDEDPKIDVLQCETDAMMDADKDTGLRLGRRLSSLRIINDTSGHARRLVVFVTHHAVCDGWQARLILDQVENAYSGQQLPREVGFNLFAQYLLQVNKEEEADYWRRQFAGPSTPTAFPSTPAESRSTWATQTQRHFFNLPGGHEASDFTISTNIRLAWALVHRAHAAADDVVFGVTVTGRNAPVPGIESVTGPTIATLPLRVQLDRNTTVHDSLQGIHNQNIDMVPYEQTGLHNIRKLGRHVAVACDFQTLLVIQLKQNDTGSKVQTREEDPEDFLLAFGNYALVVECAISEDQRGIAVRVAFDGSILSQKQMTTILQQFGHVLTEIRINSRQFIRDIDMVSPQDIEQLRVWNSEMPQPVNRCVNDLIYERQLAHPDSQAVYAWDEKLTYRELEESSSRLASHLMNLGVGPETIVPLLLEKSSLTIVTILGVLKSGGACVTLDMHQPAQRLLEIVTQTKAELLVVSESLQDLLQVYGLKKIVVSRPWLDSLTLPSSENAWRRESASAAFIVFTSGSTGRPKGIVLEHKALCTTTMAHCKEMMITSDSRMLHFASPSFDVSIYEILMTLIMGGCVCVPSYFQRMNCPGQFARDAQANTTIISPTAIRAMRPEDAPTLKTIILVGEAIPHDVVEEWSQSALVINGYGPGECTFCSTIPIDTAVRPIATVGRARGAHFWIVDPADCRRLAPIGTIGEILIQGPIMSRGYLNDSAKTLAAFVNDVPWMRLFHKHGPVRLYCSGDLGYYNADGTVVYEGRNDTQVKLRGQRIELGEVEHHLQRVAPDARVVADVVSYEGNKMELVAFILYEVNRKDESNFVILPPQQRISDSKRISSDLESKLPSYMVPSVYLPVSQMPTTSSGKTDRKRLRQIAAALKQEHLAAYQEGGTESREPTTAAELSLRKVWAELFKMDQNVIRAEDNFFHIGGNSVEAMRLVSVARRENRDLTTAKVFHYPKLCDMAKSWEAFDTSQAAIEQEWPPFSLLDEVDRESFIKKHICDPHGIQRTSVADVYPAVYEQTVASRTNHCLYAVFNMRDEQQSIKAIASWKQVVRRHDILRTTLLPYESDEDLAIVLDEASFCLGVHHRYEEEISLLVEKDIKACSSGRSPLVELFLVHYMEKSPKLVLKVNHAAYDGASLASYWSDWEKAYEGGSPTERYQFQQVLYSRAHSHKHEASCYWENFLHGAKQTFLPTTLNTNSPVDLSGPRKFQKTVSGVSAPPGLTLDSLLKSAWAVTLAKITSCQEILFWQITNWRRVGGARIESAVGPMLNLVPVRVSLQVHWAVDELCRFLQEQDVRGMQHEVLSDMEIWDLAPWDRDDIAASTFDHVKGDIESSLSLDGFNCGPQIHYSEETHEEVSFLVKSSGEDVEAVLFIPSHVESDVGRRVVDEFCSTLAVFSRNHHANIFTACT